jgi:hypothetical protein
MLALATATMIAGFVALCFPSSRAEAKATYPSPYTLSQTYSAALRLIRVDNGFKITERDPDAAYIMFDYESAESGSRVSPGAIELVPAGDHIMVFVKLPQMPRYHEEVLMNGLKRKLESEYGEPPEKRKPKPPPKEQPDAGADGSDAEGPS